MNHDIQWAFNCCNWGFYVCAFDPRTKFSPPKQDGQKMLVGPVQRRRCQRMEQIGWMDGKTGETDKNAMRCLEYLEVWKFGLWKFRSISLRLHNFFTLVEKKSSESDHRCHSVSQVSTEKSAVEVRLVWTSAMTGRIDSFDTPKIGCVLLWRISLTRRTMMCFTSFKPLEWKTMVVSYRLGRSLFDWGVTSSRSRKDGQRESLNERHGQALQAHGRWPLANF